MSPDNGREISWIWRVALLIALAAQVFLFAVRTPAGARIIPAALVRANVVPARQAEGLRSLVQHVGGKAVVALAQEIQQNVPPDCKLEVVWTRGKLAEEVADLAYRIYPRKVSQRDGIAGDESHTPCRIDWKSDSDIHLSTPTSTWSYQGEAASQ